MTDPKQDHPACAALDRDAIEQSLSSRLFQQIAADGKRVAIVDEHTTHTYEQLGERIEAVASGLRRYRPDEPAPLAVCTDHNVEGVIAILATLHAGMAYLPLDSHLPITRLQNICAAAGPIGMLHDRTHAAITEQLEPMSTRRHLLDAMSDAKPHATSAAAPVVSPDDIASVLYTSGSTGEPRGVYQNHRNTLHHIANYTAAIGIVPDDRLTLLSPLAFAASVTNMFGALLNGAALYLFDVRRHGTGPLARWLREQRITVYHSVPTLWRQVARLVADQGPLDDLRIIRLGGEPITPTDLQLAARCTRPGAQVYTALSTTETHTVCHTHIDPHNGNAAASMSAGIAPTGVQVLLLDDLGRAVPIGETGRIVVRSRHVALGYWRQPDLTRAAFTDVPGEPGVRQFDTGDLGRQLPDGDLVHLGRSDSLVKVQGLRVPLVEVEAALGQLPGVRQAAVIAQHDDNSETQLLAYVAGEASDALDPRALRAALASTLPAHMVPRHIAMLDELPLGPTGKINRAALPRITDDTNTTPAAATHAEPATPLERRLCDIFARVLRIKRVGRDDDLFTLGGQSLSAMAVASAATDALGIEVPLHLVFDHATPARLAEAVASLHHDTPDAAAPAEPTASHASPRISLAQQRLWFLEQLDPGTNVHHLGAAIRFTGPLDVARLRSALSTIIARHETLRSRIVTRDGQPTLVIAPAVVVELPIIDLPATPDANRDDAVDRHVRRLAATPFDLAHAPLWRAELLRMNSTTHVLAWAVHHAVWDAWSTDLFLNELATAYDAESTALPALQWRYQDYATDQRKRIDQPRFESQLDYWRKAMADPPSLALPTAHTSGPSTGHVTCRFSDQQSAAIDAMCRQHRVTPFMLTLAAIALVLARRGQQDDIIIGTPVADRADQRARPLIGLLLNMLPLRLRPTTQATFSNLLAQARRVVVDAGAHALVPFERIIDALALPRDMTRTPLFDVVLNAPMHRDGPVATGNLHIDSRRVDVAPPFNTLTVYLRRRAGRFLLDAAFRTHRLDDQTVTDMLDQVRHILAQTDAHADVPLEHLSLVTPASRPHLPDGRARLMRGESVTLHDMVAQQAARTPDRVAIVSPAGPWMLDEVDRRANRIARWLTAHRLAHGHVVAIRGQRGAQLVCAMLGVLKAGGAFVIIDDAHPDTWAAKMATIAAARLAIDITPHNTSEAPWLDGHPFEARLTIAVDGQQHTDPLAAFDDGAIDLNANADAPACIGFTSGTTVQPRGIVTTHRPITHFLRWQCQRFSLHDGDRVSMLSGLGHDPLLRDIFTPLTTGGTLCIPAAAAMRDPALLLDWLHDQRVTVAHLTPSLGRMLSVLADSATKVSRAPLPLRYAFFGGEALTMRDVRAMRTLAPSVRAVNFYGTTETPQAVAFHVVDADSDIPPHASLPIGQGIEASQLLVLTPAGRLAGVGEPGRIHVRSPHLSSGYVGDAALTQARFIVNPLTGDADDVQYDTGDVGWYQADGSVMYAGRADRQIKVRGHRIEPAQIEAHLASHPRVTAAAVTAQQSTDGLTLVGYIAAGADVDLDDVRRHISAALPAAMCPARLHRVDALPLTPQGKVDYAALSALAFEAPPTAQTSTPHTDTQRQLCDIWCATLGLVSVGIHDSFFNIGGDSLLAVRLFARIEQVFGHSLPLATLFQTPTIAGLAAALDDGPRAASSIMPIRAEGDKPPLFCVHGIGGDLLFLQPLLEHLPRDRPVFGFQAYGLAGDGEPDTRIDAMASRYVRDLLAEFPRGPYHLSGYSSGGVIALEMATQLRDAGHDVPIVMIIDNVAPGTRRQRPLYSPIAMTRMAMNLPRWLVDDLLHSPMQRTLLRAWGRSRLICQRACNRILGRTAPRELNTEALFGVTGMLHRRKRFYQIQYDALRAHRPRVYDGRVLLFRARTRPLWRTGEPDLGWGSIVRGPMRLINLRGTHATILLGHTGRQLAEHITRALDDVTPTH